MPHSDSHGEQAQKASTTILWLVVVAVVISFVQVQRQRDFLKARHLGVAYGLMQFVTQQIPKSQETQLVSELDWYKTIRLIASDGTTFCVQLPKPQPNLVREYQSVVVSDCLVTNLDFSNELDLQQYAVLRESADSIQYPSDVAKLNQPHFVRLDLPGGVPMALFFTSHPDTSSFDAPTGVARGVAHLKKATSVSLLKSPPKGFWPYLELADLGTDVGAPSLNGFEILFRSESPDPYVLIRNGGAITNRWRDPRHIIWELNALAPKYGIAATEFESTYRQLLAQREAIKVPLLDIDVDLILFYPLLTIILLWYSILLTYYSRGIGEMERLAWLVLNPVTWFYRRVREFYLLALALSPWIILGAAAISNWEFRRNHSCIALLYVGITIFVSGTLIKSCKRLWDLSHEGRTRG